MRVRVINHSQRRRAHENLTSKHMYIGSDDVAGRLLVDTVLQER